MTQTLNLPGRLDLAAARPLAQQLRGASGDVVLDASGVTHFGGLCLQVIIAAARDRLANGHRLTLSGVPDRILTQMHYLGVTPETLREGAV